MPYNRKAFGIVISKLRVQKGLTQEHLSGLAGIVIIPGQKTRFSLSKRATFPLIESTFPPIRSARGSFFDCELYALPGRWGCAPAA